MTESKRKIYYKAKIVAVGELVGWQNGVFIDSPIKAGETCLFVKASTDELIIDNVEYRIAESNVVMAIL